MNVRKTSNKTDFNINDIKRIDFHSHILPYIDDGARDLETALNMLSILKADGVDKVVATPHLYLHNESAESFLERRENSAGKLKEVLSGKNLPEIVIGAEVYFSTSLLDMKEETLKSLCVEGTDYLLLELPYQNFSSSFLNSVFDFINYSGCRIIFAHIERYLDFFSGSDMKSLLAGGVFSQFNCDSLESSSMRRSTLKLIKNEYIQLLGTDAHNPETRPPKFKEAERTIRKKLSDGIFARLMRTAELILLNKSTDEIFDFFN